MQESLESLTKACHCARPGADAKDRGIEDYELEGDSPYERRRGWKYYAKRGVAGTGIVGIAYVVMSAFLPLPQPWEKYFEFPGVNPTRSVHSVIADKEKDTGMDYNCDLAGAAWKFAWSLTQKAWCCRYKGKGCPPDNGYDCEENQGSWETWDVDKKYFCCGYDMEGCAGVVSESTPAGKDCQFELEGWESKWSPAKKLYCCKTHEFHCEAVPEQPQTCGAVCSTDDGVTATCQERIDYLVTHPKPDGIQGEPGACQQAHGRVSKDCDACASCSPEDAGCA